MISLERVRDYPPSCISLGCIPQLCKVLSILVHLLRSCAYKTFGQADRQMEGQEDSFIPTKSLFARAITIMSNVYRILDNLSSNTNFSETSFFFNLSAVFLNGFFSRFSKLSQQTMSVTCVMPASQEEHDYPNILNPSTSLTGLLVTQDLGKTFYTI